MKRATIGFDDALLKSIEAWRSKQRPIPQFSAAVRDLVKIGLRNIKD